MFFLVLARVATFRSLGLGIEGRLPEATYARYMSRVSLLESNEQLLCKVVALGVAGVI